MFKSIEQIDKALIGTINECRKQFQTKGLIKLFEGIEIDEPTNIVQFSDFNNNKIAYFNAVKNLFENEDFQKSTLTKTEDYVAFLNELEDEIENLLKINDFKNLLVLNPIVLQTKLFAKQELNVFGFNIMNFNDILQKYNINKIFSVMYCMTHHNLYFISKGAVYVYNIFDNTLATFKENIDEKNYKFKIANYSNNTIELDNTIDIDKLIDEKNIDNLYRDKAIQHLKAKAVSYKMQQRLIQR